MSECPLLHVVAQRAAVIPSRHNLLHVVLYREFCMQFQTPSSTANITKSLLEKINSFRFQELHYFIKELKHLTCLSSCVSTTQYKHR